MSSARPAKKPVSMPCIGPPVSATTTTRTRTRSGAPPPGSGSRLSTVSWIRIAASDATASSAARRTSAPRSRRGLGPYRTGAGRRAGPGRRGGRRGGAGGQHRVPRVGAGLGHDHAYHAEGVDAHERPDHRLAHQGVRCTLHLGDHADRDPRHIRPAARRAEGDQLLPGPEHGAAAKTSSRSSPVPEMLLPVPVTAPISPLPASRTPTVALASVVSRTVAVRPLTAVTVPTSPAPFSTVSFGLMPSRRPASIVIVSA